MDGGAGDTCEPEEDEDDVAAFLALDDVLEGSRCGRRATSAATERAPPPRVSPPPRAEGQGIDLDDESAARCAVAPRELDSALWALCDAGNGAEAAEGQAQYKARARVTHTRRIFALTGAPRRADCVVRGALHGRAAA